MSNISIKNFLNFYKNPVALFGIIFAVLSFILLFECHFALPDFYTNRELADSIAQTVPSREVNEAVKHLLNPKYGLLNCLFQLWGLFAAAFCFLLIGRVSSFKKFKELNFLNRKLFAYLWINLSYPIWGFFFVGSCMFELEKYVYNGSADSMGIPLFSIIFIVFYTGIIYYLIMNTLAFITFNTKIKRLYYNIFWIAAIITGALFAVLFSFFSRFSYVNLILDFIYVVWTFFAIYTIGYKKIKSAQ